MVQLFTGTSEKSMLATVWLKCREGSQTVNSIHIAVIVHYVLAGKVSLYSTKECYHPRYEGGIIPRAVKALYQPVRMLFYVTLAIFRF